MNCIVCGRKVKDIEGHTCVNGEYYHEDCLMLKLLADGEAMLQRIERLERAAKARTSKAKK